MRVISHRTSTSSRSTRPSPAKPFTQLTQSAFHTRKSTSTAAQLRWDTRLDAVRSSFLVPISTRPPLPVLPHPLLFPILCITDVSSSVVMLLHSRCPPDRDRAEHREADGREDLCDEYVYWERDGYGCCVHQRAMIALPTPLLPRLNLLRHRFFSCGE